MGIRETALNAAARILGMKLEPQKTSASAESRDGKLFEPSAKEDKSKLELMYELCPEVNRAINFHASQVSNFEIEYGDAREEKIFKEFLKTLSPSGSADKFREIIYKTSVSSDVFGFGPLELHSEGTAPFTISIVHPNNIEPKKIRNNQGAEVLDVKKGKVLNWVDKTTKKTIAGKFIPTLTYNTFGDEIYGISLVQVCYNAAISKLNIELGLAAAIFKTGFPTITFAVGDETKNPTVDLMKSAKEIVEDFGSVREFVHEHWIKPKMLESFALPQATNYTEPFIRSIATGSGLPEAFLTGRMKELTYNSAPILLEVLTETIINPRRAIIKTFVEGEIFYKLFEAHGIKEPKTRIVYEPAFPRIKKDTALTAKTLSEVKIGEENAFTKEEIRDVYMD